MYIKIKNKQHWFYITKNHKGKRYIRYEWDIIKSK